MPVAHWSRTRGKRNAEINLITFPNGRKMHYEIRLTKRGNRSAVTTHSMRDESFASARKIAKLWLEA